jgi:two-component system sensor histidine kinase DesK
VIKTKWNFDKINWENYIWLVFLPYNIVLYLPVTTANNWFWLSLIGGFLVVYILVAELPHWRRVTIPLEIIITGSFALLACNFYMMIFSAWQLSFLFAKQHQTRKFRWFVLVYYSVFLLSIWQMARTVGFGDTSELTGLIFPLLSPMMAYVFGNAIRRRWQLSQTNRRLENLVRRGERDRIARDLHDTLGQSFSMITVKTELAQKLFEKGSDQVLTELKDIEKTSRQNLQLVRGIVNDLRQRSLNEVLFEQGKNLATARIFMLTKNEEMVSNWSTEVQNDLAAVLIETLTNVIRHAKAIEVQIKFSETPDRYQIEVQDDGRVKAKTYERTASNGIKGMRERMQLKQGTFEITKNEIGTLVTFSLPKE